MTKPWRQGCGSFLVVSWQQPEKTVTDNQDA